jgi:hypothetical protein
MLGACALGRNVHKHSTLVIPFGFVVPNPPCGRLGGGDPLGQGKQATVFQKARARNKNAARGVQGAPEAQGCP